MKNLTPELIAKARAAKSAEELLALAKENGIEMTEEEAKICFDQLHTNAAISDDELEAIAGGGCFCDYFEKFFRLSNSANESSVPKCCDESNISNVPNVTTLPYVSDAPRSDNNITTLPYDSKDKNKIMLL